DSGDRAADWRGADGDGGGRRRAVGPDADGPGLLGDGVLFSDADRGDSGGGVAEQQGEALKTTHEVVTPPKRPKRLFCDETRGMFRRILRPENRLIGVFQGVFLV